jgi:hypothetical protein
LALCHQLSGPDVFFFNFLKAHVTLKSHYVSLIDKTMSVQPAAVSHNIGP